MGTQGKFINADNSASTPLAHVRRLIIATSNIGKIIEIRSALGEVEGWSFESLPAGIPGIEETGETFMDNAILKAGHYSTNFDALTLADDSGLCVAALEGRPGVHSARYAPNPAARIARLLREMEPVEDADRKAVFYCALALARSGEIVWSVQSEVAGEIVRSPSGAEGFGYDPVFRLPALNCTMAELPTEKKNCLSARGQALVELKRFLASI
jgi:XTP/dITP diphosphohydrolase